MLSNAQGICTDSYTTLVDIVDNKLYTLHIPDKENILLLLYIFQTEIALSSSSLDIYWNA